MFVAGQLRVATDVVLPLGTLEQSVSVTAAATGVLPRKSARRSRCSMLPWSIASASRTCSRRCG